MKIGLVYTIFFGSVLSGFSTFGATPACSPSAHDVRLTQAIKWYRIAAEKKALYRQAFNVGSDYVLHWVRAHHPKMKSWGVVLDIDETTLDNSWYFQKCEDVADDENNFEHFVTIPKHSIAQPGVIQFTRLVHQLGGYVSLVSNRDGSYEDASGKALQATIDNVRRQGIYFDQVVLANYKKSPHPTDKNPRFKAIETGKYDATSMVWSNELPAHPIIAFFGDNIQDFPVLKQANLKNISAEDKIFNRFGRGYFILPNPMYGSWG